MAACFDEPGSGPVDKFYVLDGNCRKCGSGPNSLVWIDFVQNRRVASQSIFRVRCVACGASDVVKARDIDRIEDRDLTRKSIPPPPESLA
jgi:hypothetical protein